MNPYYMKSMTPSAFESALRQKEGELASYMSRLVCIAFFLNLMLKVLLVTTYLHAVCCIVHSGAEFRSVYPVWICCIWTIIWIYA